MPMTRRTRFLVNEHPAIAAQWHPDLNADLDLAQIGPGSHKAVFWQCEDGHVWQAQVHSRVAVTGCPQCAGYVPRGRTTLSEHSHDLVAEWHPSNDASPDQFGPGSQRKVWWRCPAGHEYQARISNRSRAPARCLAGVPELFAQVDPDIVPAGGSPTAGQLPRTAGMAPFQGPPLGGEVSHRTVAGSGCPACARRKRAPALPEARRTRSRARPPRLPPGRRTRPGSRGTGQGDRRGGRALGCAAEPGPAGRARVAPGCGRSASACSRGPRLCPAACRHESAVILVAVEHRPAACVRSAEALPR
ncbi:hypothetical protein C6376_40540 [Streptomyces sp. P3]|nr:hypothetical protein C6376_40540 [Streptomyces sp. P3]